MGITINNLDYQQHGLGSASCGPDVTEPNQLQNKDFEFAVHLRPFSVDEMSQVEISKSLRLGSKSGKQVLTIPSI